MHYPQILSWLSTRAGLSEAEGRDIWDRIIADAAHRYTEPEIGSPAYWDDVVTQLHHKLAIEASRNGKAAWLDELQAEQPFSTLLNCQVSLLTQMMLGWRDVALASTRPWNSDEKKDLAA